MNSAATSSISTTYVNITPEIAAEMLTRNKKNRNLRPFSVRAYANDMKAGHWRTTHQGIAFSTNGELSDGQHRLHAIILANTPIMMQVTTGMEKECSLVVDMGDRRQAHDSFLMAGDDWITRDFVSVVRVLMNKMGMNLIRSTNDEIKEFAEKHKEPILKALDMPYRKKRGMTSAAMLASYACAIAAGESEEKITRFANILISGEINGPHENACIRLREYILENPDLWSAEPVSAARRAQRALGYFCKGKSITRLQATDVFEYPILGQEV